MLVSKDKLLKVSFSVHAQTPMARTPSPKSWKPIENILDGSHKKTYYVELRIMKVTYPENYIKAKYDIFQTTWDLGLIPPPSFWSMTVMVMMVVLRCLVGGHFSEKSLKQRIEIFVSKSFFHLMCPIFASINPFFEYFCLCCVLWEYFLKVHCSQLQLEDSTCFVDAPQGNTLKASGWLA